MRRYRDVLRHADVRRLMIASVVAGCGTWASTVVLTGWLFDVTGSLVWLALLASTRWVPGLIAAPFAGVVADRFDRRMVLIVSATLGGLLAAAVAAVVAADGPPLLVLVLLTLAAIVASPFRPAAGALAPDLVDADELPTANSLLAVVQNLVVVVGPALGALLLLLDAPAVGVGANAASFFAGALVAARLTVRSRGVGTRGGDPVRQIARGIRALRAAPTAGVLLVFLAVDTLLAWAYGVVYLPVGKHIGLGASGYGVLLAAAAAGGLIGAAIAGRLADRRRIAPVILGGVLVQALPFAAIAYTTDPVLGTALLVVSGIGMVVVEVVTMVAVQREVPIARLSSVLGLLDLTMLAASAVGGFTASGILSALPTPSALLVLGLGDAALALLLSPFLLMIDRRAAVRTESLRDRVALLQALPLFAELSPARLEALAAAMRPLSLDEGDRLIVEGARADALYVLAAGRLQATSTATGHGGAPLPTVMAPDVVGEIGVLRSLPRTASVTAASPCTVWRITADDYLDSLTLQRIPRMMLGDPTDRLRRTHPQLVTD